MAAVRSALPDALVVGSGTDLTVYKGTGHPRELARTYDLAGASGLAGLRPHPDGHRIGGDTRRLPPVLRRARPVSGAQRIVRQPRDDPAGTAGRGCASSTPRTTPRSAPGSSPRAWRRVEDLDMALRALCETFDGFYTLLVTQPGRLRRRPRRDRVQAGDHRRDAALGSRWPRSTARWPSLPGIERCPHLRTRAGEGLRMATLTPPSVRGGSVRLAACGSLTASCTRQWRRPTRCCNPQGAHALAVGIHRPTRRGRSGGMPATTAPG